jgi:hypothetical protein
LNGRAVGDIQGQYTSYQYNGASVIDYCVVNRELVDGMVYFKVMKPTHLSDHSPISLCVDGIPMLSTDCTVTNYSKFPRGFKWNNSNAKYGEVDVIPYVIIFTMLIPMVLICYVKMLSPF